MNESDLEEEVLAGFENLRAMFRQSMAASAGPDESLEEVRARIAVDPATREIARLLRTTVEELLDGLGTPQVFEVDEGYDPASAEASIAAVLETTLEIPVGASADPAVGDRIADRELRHEGAHAAPHVEAPRAQVFGAERDARLIQEMRMNAMGIRPPKGARPSRPNERTKPSPTARG